MCRYGKKSHQHFKTTILLKQFVTFNPILKKSCFKVFVFYVSQRILFLNKNMCTLKYKKIINFFLYFIPNSFFPYFDYISKRN